MVVVDTVLEFNPPVVINPDTFKFPPIEALLPTVKLSPTLILLPKRALPLVAFNQNPALVGLLNVALVLCKL